jgi:hypothetical protein
MIGGPLIGQHLIETRVVALQAQQHAVALRDGPWGWWRWMSPFRAWLRCRRPSARAPSDSPKRGIEAPVALYYFGPHMPCAHLRQ